MSKTSNNRLICFFFSFQDLSTHLQTHEGRKIMQSCNNGVLTQTTREMLVQDIIRNYVTKNKFMLETDFVKISKNIIDIFPKETMVNEFSPFKIIAIKINLLIRIFSHGTTTKIVKACQEVVFTGPIKTLSKSLEKQICFRYRKSVKQRIKLWKLVSIITRLFCF